MIVTSNLRHFPAAALAPLGVEAQSPDEFLTNLWDLDADQMGQIIEEQAASLRNPPMTAEDVLERLAASAPTFVQLAKEQLI